MSAIRWLLAAFGRQQALATAAAYRRIFNSADGRLILADLAAYCRVNATSFTPGDPHQTAFNEGARDAFLHVLDCAGLTPADLSPLTATAEEPDDAY